jgi:hypothetical protein
LEPRFVDTLAKIENVGNEYILGEEVINLIREEQAAALRVNAPWRNHLGIVQMGDPMVSVRVQEDSRPGRMAPVVFEICEALDGSEGRTVQMPLEKQKSNHRTLQVSADCEGAITMEDYSVSAYWKQSGNLVKGGTRAFPYIYSGCTSPLRKEAVLALDTDIIVHLDENLQTVREVSDIQCRELLFTKDDSVLACTGGETFSILDLRTSGKSRIEWNGGKSRNEWNGGTRSGKWDGGTRSGKWDDETRSGKWDDGTRSGKWDGGTRLGKMSSFDMGGRVAVGGDSLLLLFDLRFLSQPVFEIDYQYIGCKNISWLDWIAKGNYCGSYSNC